MPKEATKKYFENWRTVYKDRRLKGLDLPILMLIKDTNFKDFYVAQGKFAESIGCGRKAVNESLNTLVVCKYLERTDNNKQGSHKPHHFRLNGDLISNSPDLFPHESDGLHDMSPNGYMRKNKVVPVMSPMGYTNDINDKDITLSVSEKKSSSNTQEYNDLSFLDDSVSTETPPETYPAANRELEIYNYAKECRPTDKTPLNTKFAENISKALELHGEEETRKALANWGCSRLYMTMEDVFKNDNNFCRALSQRSVGGLRQGYLSEE